MTGLTLLSISNDKNIVKTLEQVAPEAVRLLLLTIFKNKWVTLHPNKVLSRLSCSCPEVGVKLD